MSEKMFEIYDSHADGYEELVQAEDYQDNLRKLLHEIIDWRDLSILEAGVGTGRVTRLFIDDAASAVCCDRSENMLDYACEILVRFEDKLRLVCVDNEDLPDLGAGFDVFIEGWSFGHSVSDCNGVDEIRDMTETLIKNATKGLKPGGVMILIETLGTNVDFPEAPSENLEEFYAELEHEHGFEAHQIRTDYRFDTIDEAARVMGFFFGDEMADAVRERDALVIPEWTGVWVKTI